MTVWPKSLFVKCKQKSPLSRILYGHLCSAVHSLNIPFVLCFTRYHNTNAMGTFFRNATVLHKVCLGHWDLVFDNN